MVERRRSGIGTAVAFGLGSIGAAGFESLPLAAVLGIAAVASLTWGLWPASDSDPNLVDRWRARLPAFGKDVRVLFATADYVFNMVGGNYAAAKWSELRGSDLHSFARWLRVTAKDLPELDDLDELQSRLSHFFIDLAEDRKRHGSFDREFVRVRVQRHHLVTLELVAALDRVRRDEMHGNSMQHVAAYLPMLEEWR